MTTTAEPAFASRIPSSPAPGAGRGRQRHVEPQASRDPYQMAHDRCRARRGRASRYRCVDCRERASDWSLKPHPAADLHVVGLGGSAMWFSSSPWDYEPRCSGCHRAEDCRRRLEFEDTWERVLQPAPYTTREDDEFEGWWYR